MIWQVHFLNARHGLTRVMPEVRAAVGQAMALAGVHLALPPVDVVVRAGEGIPDWGVAGHAPAPGVIELTVDPARFDAGRVIRTMVHELHHLVRWDGPGYGRSLGAALVSEGLAGHFVMQVLGGPADPWDATVPSGGLAKRAVTEWAWLDYDHGLWFLGKGNIRRWAGYGLGYRLVAEHLSRLPEADAATLAHAPAEGFRPALRRLTGVEDQPLPEEAVPEEEAPEPEGAPGAEVAPDGEVAPDTETAPQPDAAPDLGGEEPTETA